MIYLLVAATAAAARGLYLAQMMHAPFFDLRTGDGKGFHLWARQIAAGQWWGEGVFYQAPLYPYVLALIYKVVGQDVLAVRTVHLLMGVAACVLLTKAAGSFFGRRAALITGLIAAVYPPSIFLESLIQKTALAYLLMTILLAIVGAMQQRSSSWRWWCAGVVLGLLVLTRENSLVFAPLMLIWLALGFGQQRWRTRIIWAAAFVFGLALVMAPVTVRNRIKGGTAITTVQVGVNFFIGNNPEADGTYRPIRYGRGNALNEVSDAHQLAEQALGHKATAAQATRYWFGRAWQYIRTQPMDWFKLLGRKAALTFNADEVPDTVAQGVYTRWSPWLRWSGAVLHFGVLLPLAVFGLGVTVTAWRRVWIIYLMLAGYAAAVVVFFVFARYRFPLAPLLMIFAGAGLSELIALLRQRRFVDPAAVLVLAVACALGSNVRMFDVSATHAMTYGNLANYLANERRYDDAVKFYGDALKINPHLAVIHNDLGTVLFNLGQLQRAAGHFQIALKQRPDFIDARFKYAYALEILDQRDAAMREYEHTLRLDPNHVKALDRYGLLLAMSDNGLEAEKHFERALQIQPDYLPAQQHLAKLRRIMAGQRNEPE